jgi:hypothetical protein
VAELGSDALATSIWLYKNAEVEVTRGLSGGLSELEFFTAAADGYA